MTIPQSKKIRTVEGSDRPNPFPMKGDRQPREGNQFPRMVGITPNVIRGDAFTPILPKGMIGNPGFIDESVNGQTMSFKNI